MSLKLRTIFVLNLLFMSSVLSVGVMNKYGTATSYTGDIYLDVSGFVDGEKIYISVTTSYCGITNLQYRFYESTSISNSLTNLFSVSYTSSSYTDTYYSYEEEYNYKIEKQSGGYKYLYLKSSCNRPIYFENTEEGDSTVAIILAVVFSVIAIAIIITIIVCCCRRCKRARVYGTVPYPVTPVTPVYGVSPYAAQPVISVGSVQPIINMHAVQPMQPYGANPNYTPSPNVNQNYNQVNNNPDIQYNSAAPVPPGSDVRINQDVRYEKPH